MNTHQMIDKQIFPAMLFKNYHLGSLPFRQISTNTPKLSTIAVSEKDEYYKKIGNKALNNEDLKPPGWYQAKPFKAIPGPKPLPLIGNMWRFMPGGDLYNLQLIDIHKSLRQKYGDLIYFSGMLGKTPMLFSYDPDDIELCFRNEGPWPIRYGLESFVYYRNHIRNDVFGGVGGILTVQGEKWFNARSIVNKILMQPRTAEMYVDSMDKVANDLIGNIRRFSRSNPRNEMPEDFQTELYKWTLESMGVITYNRRIGCLDPNATADSVGLRMIDGALQLFNLFYRMDILPSLWPFISTRNWRKLVKVLDFFTETNMKYVEECLAKADPNPHILDSERSVLERLSKTDKRVAFAMVTDMMIAGIDTTGKTMASALYFLAKNPDKQEKLRQEIRSSMPTKNSPVTKEFLRSSLYLKAVIKETTRMAPIAIGTPRTTVRDLVLGGYQVPKGTSFLAVNLLTATSDQHFPQAEKYIPERWLRSTTDDLSYKNVHPFAFMPFGFGPRSCVGKRLANLELEVGLSKVVRNFNLSWEHPDATFGMDLLYGIQSPLKFKAVELPD